MAKRAISKRARVCMIAARLRGRIEARFPVEGYSPRVTRMIRRFVWLTDKLPDV